jgi:hypothetical protein
MAGLKKSRDMDFRSFPGASLLEWFDCNDRKDVVQSSSSEFLSSIYRNFPERFVREFPMFRKKCDFRKNRGKSI